MKLEDLTHEIFAGHLHATFRIHAGDESVEVELIEVETFDLGVQAEGMRQPFSLIFMGSRERVVPEGTYRVESGATGSMEVFLVPIATLGKGQQYQVVFS